MPGPRFFVIVAAKDVDGHFERAARHGQLGKAVLFSGSTDEVYGATEVSPVLPAEAADLAAADSNVAAPISVPPATEAADPLCRSCGKWVLRGACRNVDCHEFVDIADSWTEEDWAAYEVKMDEAGFAPLFAPSWRAVYEERKAERSGSFDINKS